MSAGSVGPRTPEARAALWKRLAKLAGQIRDDETRAQYLSAWRARFDAQFPPPPPGLSDDAMLPSSGADVRLSDQEEREQAVLRRIARHWFDRQLTDYRPQTPDSLNRFAWWLGRRVSAELIEDDEATGTLTVLATEVVGARRDHIDASYAAGRGKGYDLASELATLECALMPQTDLGNLERFLRRHGRDFLFVEQWGWLVWDGRRWNRDMAVPMLGRAVQDTMRAIQDEAAMIAATGQPDSMSEGDDAEGIARPATPQDRLDRVVQTKGGKVTLFSDTATKWGRTSEGAGHISCIAKMAEARRSARPDDFDGDPLLFNVANGTLAFSRDPAGATVVLRAHSRDDRITKIAAVGYDPDAECPRYDAFLQEVQPEADMRAFLDCWGGYNLLGLADAQKFALYYGQGSNGKSVDVDTKAHIMGDYARVCGIETFIDQGKYRKGSDATPDLAALAGRRMVRASEPEDGSKFSDGLIKAMTGSEPVPVRELMKPPFEMQVTFKVTVSANNKPRIGTDHGIQRRVQLVPWNVIIPDGRQDTQLTGKLKAEGSGILNRLVRGALAYLDRGLPVPDAVREATREYQEENDLLGQFLALCIEKSPGVTMGASALHGLFAAWQTWAQQLAATGKPWSAKYLNAQMQKRGYRVRKSSSMVWDDIAPLYAPEDFVDFEGKARTSELPAPRGAAVTVNLSVDEDSFSQDEDSPWV